MTAKEGKLPGIDVLRGMTFKDLNSLYSQGKIWGKREAGKIIFYLDSSANSEIASFDDPEA